ncbi:hypothetical protein niasHT_010334 [Heterodera trifolii]|uniref:Uncharacterized protein n=1 Tax=Heterodera trifolii TaxID=157864 RepID=A0ABD2M6N9_9BILA
MNDSSDEKTYLSRAILGAFEPIAPRGDHPGQSSRRTDEWRTLYPEGRCTSAPPAQPVAYPRKPNALSFISSPNRPSQLTPPPHQMDDGWVRIPSESSGTFHRSSVKRWFGGLCTHTTFWAQQQKRRRQNKTKQRSDRRRFFSSPAPQQTDEEVKQKRGNEMG